MQHAGLSRGGRGRPKARRYRRIASCYLMEHYPLKAIRFDAVGVTIRGGHIAEIEHQYNAFDWQVS